MKITKDPIKTLLKNGYIFFLKLLNFRKDFLIDLEKLQNKWPSKYRKKPLGFAWDYKREEVIKKRKLAYSQRIKFINSIKKKDKAPDFYKDINDFLKKYDFGYEWFTSIINYVVSLWLFPPLYNLDIENSDKRVLITLNPDTSLDDIRAAWPKIKKKQKELWPNFKKINLTQKSFKNLNIAIRDLEERYTKPKEETSYSGEGEEKYKLTDLDIAGKIWEEEKDITAKTDKKRKQNLRQIRRRYTNKLP